jgi:replicative DNA helicase
VDRRSGARLEDTLLEYMTLLVRRAAEDPASRLVLPWAALKPFVPPLAPGTMIGIIANPGVGKTAFIECCLEKWARLGKRCALFHYELSLPVMLDRRMQRHSAIPIARLRCGIADGSPEWQLVSEVTDRISKWPGEIIYVHCPRWSAAQVAAEATRLHDEQRLDVIALDYLNKIPVPHANGFNFAQRRGQDIEEFKTVCEQLGVVGLLAAQFDKASKTSRDPTQYGLAGARDTGELLDKSNVGLALGRPCPEYDDENVTKVVVDKVNDGRTGTAFMYFRGDRLSFTDLHPEGE